MGFLVYEGRCILFLFSIPEMNGNELYYYLIQNGICYDRFLQWFSGNCERQHTIETQFYLKKNYIVIGHVIAPLLRRLLKIPPGVSNVDAC